MDAQSKLDPTRVSCAIQSTPIILSNTSLLFTSLMGNIWPGRYIYQQSYDRQLIGLLIRPLTKLLLVLLSSAAFALICHSWVMGGTTHKLVWQVGGHG